jgi:hypothetical protein
MILQPSPPVKSAAPKVAIPLGSVRDTLHPSLPRVVQTHTTSRWPSVATVPLGGNAKSFATASPCQYVHRIAPNIGGPCHRSFFGDRQNEVAVGFARSRPQFCLEFCKKAIGREVAGEISQEDIIRVASHMRSSSNRIVSL